MQDLRINAQTINVAFRLSYVIMPESTLEVTAEKRAATFEAQYVYEVDLREIAQVRSQFELNVVSSYLTGFFLNLNYTQIVFIIIDIQFNY